jgi:hypothetical protein
MSYIEIIVLVVSVLAIIISLFAISLAMMFYQLYSRLSLLITEMSKGLEMSTMRLERIPKLLYDQDSEEIDSSEQNTLFQRQPGENKKQEQGSNSQMMPESDVI